MALQPCQVLFLCGLASVLAPEEMKSYIKSVVVGWSGANPVTVKLPHCRMLSQSQPKCNAHQESQGRGICLLTDWAVPYQASFYPVQPCRTEGDLSALSLTHTHTHTLSSPQVEEFCLHPGASSAKSRLEEESCSLILLPGCSNSPVIAIHFVLFLKK